MNLVQAFLNVNRYSKEYSGKDSPKFIKGPVFKMIVPIPETNIGGSTEGITEGISEGISEGITHEVILKVGDIVDDIIDNGSISDDVKDKIKDLLLVIYKNGGVGTADIEKRIKIPKKSLERYIKRLKNAGLIEFRGVRRTGGYFLTKKIKDKISKKK